jgi:hypothetical protein
VISVRSHENPSESGVFSWKEGCGFHFAEWRVGVLDVNGESSDRPICMVGYLRRSSRRSCNDLTSFL